MSINFSKFTELSEASQKALKVLTGDKAFSDQVASAVTNRLDAASQSSAQDIEEQKKKVKEFRDNNLKLTESLKSFEGFDADEYKKLKELGTDTAQAAEKIKAIETEWKAKYDGAEKKALEAEKISTELALGREQDAFTFDVHRAIEEHNAKYPSLKVENGAEKVIIQHALGSRKNVDGKTVMLDGDKEFTTDDGFGTISEWMNTVHRPNNQFCYTQPQGGGATGGDGSSTQRPNTSVGKIAAGLSERGK